MHYYDSNKVKSTPKGNNILQIEYDKRRENRLKAKLETIKKDKLYYVLKRYSNLNKDTKITVEEASIIIEAILESKGIKM